MNIVRKALPVIIVSVLLVGVVYGFIYLRTRTLEKADPLDFIPEDFALLIKANSITRAADLLRNENRIWKVLSAYPGIQKINRTFLHLDSLISVDESIRNYLENPSYISFHPEPGGVAFLLLHSQGSFKDTGPFEIFLGDSARVESEKFENVRIYHSIGKLPGFFSGLYYFERNGVLAASSNAELLKRSIRQMNSSGGLNDDLLFREIIDSEGEDVPANVYLNYSVLDSLLSGIFKSELNIRASGVARYSGLDLDIEEENLVMNGFTTTGDSSGFFLDVFRGQEAVRFTTFDILPSNTASLMLLGFSDGPAFSEALSDSPFGSKGGRFRKYANEFYELLRSEAGRFVITEGENGYFDYAFFALRGTEITRQFISTAFLSEGMEDPLEKRQVINFDGNVDIPVYRMNSSEFLNSVMTGIPGNKRLDFFLFYENYLIFGESLKALRELLYSNLLGKTLANEESFRELSNNFSSRSNVFFYGDPSLLFNRIRTWFGPQSLKIFENNKEAWKKINAVSFQSTWAGRLHIYRVYVHYSGEARSLARTVWERKLDTLSVTKPAILINHNTGEKEIFIQDAANTLYLISNRGNILWKQKTKGRVLGEVKQIDLYRNGKLQIIFNTADKLYVLDRNGNPVDNFPVSLRENASAGLQVFDYDKDGTFRFPVPVENKDILMYDREGKIVSGWRFRATEHPVKHPPQHFRISDDDFIIVKDDYRIYMLNRRGRERVEPRVQVPLSPKNPVWYDRTIGENNARLIVSGIDGSVYYFYFSGRVDKFFDGDLGEDHFFVAEDLDGDRSNEFIFVEGNKLWVYDRNRALLFSHIFPNKIHLRPVIYEFSAGDKKIGVSDTEEGLIYLFNNDGSLYPGFPLRGSGLFSISAFPELKDRFNLIVGNQNNFLYNYTVK